MVKIITDYGYCFGVANAVKILEKTSKVYSNIYLTHPLIHNLSENAFLMQANHALLLTENIFPPQGSAIVFSAHGHPLEEEKPFDSNDFHKIDATCPLIRKRYEWLKNIKEDTVCFFLGKNNHEETLGFLSHFPRLVFVDSETDFEAEFQGRKKIEKALIIPQTTISQKKVDFFQSVLKKHCDNIDTLPICPLYEKRLIDAVTCLKDKDPKTSCFVVVGAKISSNANEIYKAIKKANPLLEGELALSIDDLDENSYKGKDIYLASATSVSQETVLKLAEELKNRS
ncbi:MAG: hypothetical protein WCS80_01985 [Bacilli bacterium]